MRHFRFFVNFIFARLFRVIEVSPHLGFVGIAFNLNTQIIVYLISFPFCIDIQFIPTGPIKSCIHFCHPKETGVVFLRRSHRPNRRDTIWLFPWSEPQSTYQRDFTDFRGKQRISIHITTHPHSTSSPCIWLLCKYHSSGSATVTLNPTVGAKDAPLSVATSSAF